MNQDMSKTELTKTRDALAKKLESAEAAHARAFAAHVREGDYNESCQRINEIYQQLSEVSDLLGEPVPVRF